MILLIILKIFVRKDERELLPFAYREEEPYRIFAIKQEQYLHIKHLTNVNSIKYKIR